jgi:hypothetical protein
LITPEAAMTSQHTSATAENRVAATRSASPRGNRRAKIISATRPPTHNDAPTRWNTRLLDARSCWPPDDECPVIGTGRTANTASPNSTVVQPQDSTMNEPTEITSAMAAVSSHALACSSRLTRSNMRLGLSTIDHADRPTASPTMNGIDASAATNHSSAAHAAVRSAA